MYIRRSLENVINDLGGQFLVIMVTGARQVGKTTLLRHLAEGNRQYVTLDNPLDLELAKTDAALFLEKYRPPVLIDEIQHAPELLPLIKLEIDQQQKAGAYWLTGSQPFHLMKNVSESLAGRVGLISLFGLSTREIQGEPNVPFIPEVEELYSRAETAVPMNIQQLYERIWTGSFPARVSGRIRDWNVFYDSYLQTYLQRDVRDHVKVGDLMSFTRFIRAAAARTAQLLNVSDLARDADVAVSTAKRWVSILQASGIVYLLQPWFSNVTKRIVKTPKLYFLDTGLCAYLTGWSSPQTLEAGAMSGAIFETFVVGEILKSYYHNGRRPEISFFRNHDKKEIDLLIERDGRLYPLEIKKTASPSRNHVRHMSILPSGAAQKVGAGGLICMTKEVRPLTRDISAIPVDIL